MKCFQVLVFTFLFPFFSIKADEALENAYILVVEDTDVDADQMRLSVDANLSVNDLVVTNNISMNDSASSSVGNIMKNGVRFIHNFGNNNTFTGIRAGNFTMSGDSNSGFGTNALRRTVSGRGNTAIGTNALTENVTGTQNTAVGFRSMESANNSSFNTAVGYRSLLNSFGAQSNVAIGYQSLEFNTTGSFNVAIGRSSLRNNASGSRNIAIGYQAGMDAGTGNDNIYIGNRGTANDSGIIRIGNNPTHQGCFIQGVYQKFPGPNSITVLIGSDGQLGTIPSSKRFKSNIQEMTNESDKIFALTPVSFIYNADETRSVQYGLIAEEVDAVFPALVVHDADGTAYTVRYEVLPVLLLNEMKKQKQDITDLKEIVAQLHAQVQRFVAG